MLSRTGDRSAAVVGSKGSEMTMPPTRDQSVENRLDSAQHIYEVRRRCEALGTWTLRDLSRLLAAQGFLLRQRGSELLPEEELHELLIGALHGYYGFVGISEGATIDALDQKLKEGAVTGWGEAVDAAAAAAFTAQSSQSDRVAPFGARLAVVPKADLIDLLLPILGSFASSSANI